MMNATRDLLRSRPATGYAGRAAQLRALYLPCVEAMIRDVAAEVWSAESTVHDLVAFQMASGGKRMRAVHPLLVASAMGADPERLVPFAAACEVLHNATLVHDDIQDGDSYRRGQKTAWRRFGVSRAINLGDAMLFLAVELAQRVPASPAARLSAVQRIVKTALALVDGQDRELAQRSGDVRPVPRREDYFALVGGKTSSLFSLPLAGAAELCGATSPVVTCLEGVARELGVLFQIQDDILDLYGDKGRDIRKSDLFEGKRSFLVVAACERLSREEAQQLLDLLDIPRDRKTASDVNAIERVLDKTGALGAALDEAQQICKRVEAAAPAALADLLTNTTQSMLQPIRLLLESAPRSGKPRLRDRAELTYRPSGVELAP